MATAARTLPRGYGAKEIKLGDRRNDLGIQAGRKLILIYEPVAHQISSNIIISQSKISNISAIYQQYISNISAKYHSILKPWQESHSKQNIQK
jgi:hypothetical protein